MPGPEHHDQAEKSVRCAVITVSDTRTLETDTSGKLIRDRLAARGHTLGSYEILPDEPERIRRMLIDLAGGGQCEAVIISGGTGLARRDTTYEAVAGLLDKRLDGFGELFRMLSFREIGPAAMLSRAIAGTCRTTLIFALPGSPAAVRLAMDELILPELGHMAALLKTEPGRGS